MKVNRLRERYNRRQLVVLLMLLYVVFLALPGCESGEPVLPEEVETTLSVSSSAFQKGSKIPTKYTCEGQDVSPALTWGEPPAGTQSLALIVDDPDAPAGVWTHWVIFNLPADSRELPEAVPSQDQLSSGALQGRNDFGNIGYGGPCPPPGGSHRYYFTLYALDKLLDLKAGASKKQVLDAMQGHILAQGQLMGTYQR